MQEYLEEKMASTLSEGARGAVVVVRGAEPTARTLAKALLRMLTQKDKTYRGTQTAEQLAGQNAGLENIEITDDNIKAFESIARKHGVDFELKKDPTQDPPKWLVYFNAKDNGKNIDALTAAFAEFTAKTLKQERDKPSVIELLKKAKARVKEAVVDRTRAKEHGSPEL